MSTIPKWTEDRTVTLESMVETGTMVTIDVVEQAAEVLETNTRSIAAKLRNLGYTVETTVVGKAFSDEEAAEITEFLEANPNMYTYAEIAVSVCNGDYSAKKIQGKILSMELTSLVNPTPKVERVKAYSDEEEAKILSLLAKNSYIEDIAEALGKEVNSIRGKILSMSRADESITIPKQKTYKTSVNEDAIAALGDNISEMSIEDIAESIGKTERGVKTMLTHRKLSCANYNGAKKAEKIADAKAA